MRRLKKKDRAIVDEMLTQIVDIDQMPTVNKIKVSVNDVPTDLQIGDKLVYPEDSGCLKTVISMTIFEDGTVNYMLKWYDGDFKTEMVSLTDLKLLKENSLLKKVSGYADVHRNVKM